MINDDLHVVHACAAGLDIHKMQITATVRRCATNTGLPRCQTGSFSALPGGLRELVAWLRQEQVEAAAMEATGVYWQAPFDAIREAGIEVYLMHAQQVKQLRGRKTDIEDSRWLARICQFDLGNHSFVPSKEFRDLRALSRHRRKLVQTRSRVRNRAQKVLDRCGVRIGGVLTDVFGVNGRLIIDGLIHQLPSDRIVASLSSHVRGKIEDLAEALQVAFNDKDRLVLSDLVNEYDMLNERIESFNKHIEEGLQSYRRQLKLLQTIPGIDWLSACTILIEMGADITVFGNAQSFAAWCGVCPGNKESAGKRHNVATRAGNSVMRAALVECAHGAARTNNCQFKGYHKALMVRRGYKKAIVATVHKLAKVIFAVLRDDKPYCDPEIDYETLLVKRNAPRWLRQLKQFNILQEQGSGIYRVNWNGV